MMILSDNYWGIHPIPANESGKCPFLWDAEEGLCGNDGSEQVGKSQKGRSAQEKQTDPREWRFPQGCQQGASGRCSSLSSVGTWAGECLLWALVSSSLHSAFPCSSSCDGTANPAAHSGKPSLRNSKQASCRQQTMPPSQKSLSSAVLKHATGTMRPTSPVCSDHPISLAALTNVELMKKGVFCGYRYKETSTTASKVCKTPEVLSSLSKIIERKKKIEPFWQCNS